MKLDIVHRQAACLNRVNLAQLAEILADPSQRRTPVIVTDVFGGRVPEIVSSLANIKNAVGDEPLVIRENYINSTSDILMAFHKGKAKRPAEKRTTVKGYLEMIERGECSSWLATEVPTPQKVLTKIQLDSVGIKKVSGGYGDSTVATDDVAHSLMFIASAGNASDLHTDWDGRDVILYQAVGRKRVTLFPTEEGAKLHPVQIFGTVRLTGLAEGTRAELVDYARGWDEILHPGEAVFIPALYWHHLEYVDTGVSLSFRFGGIKTTDLRFILRYGHVDFRLHRMLAAALETESEDRVANALRPVVRSLNRKYRSAKEKYRVVSECYREAFAAFYTDGAARDRFTWLDCTMLLDDVMCARYGVPTPGQSRVGGWLWMQQERLRRTLRLWGYRFASLF